MFVGEQELKVRCSLRGINSADQCRNVAQRVLERPGHGGIAVSSSVPIFLRRRQRHFTPK